jgi:hypothetical protein
MVKNKYQATHVLYKLLVKCPCVATGSYLFFYHTDKHNPMLHMHCYGEKTICVHHKFVVLQKPI